MDNREKYDRLERELKLYIVDIHRYAQSLSFRLHGGEGPDDLVGAALENLLHSWQGETGKDLLTLLRNDILRRARDCARRSRSRANTLNEFATLQSYGPDEDRTRPESSLMVSSPQKSVSMDASQEAASSVIERHESLLLDLWSEVGEGDEDGGALVEAVYAGANKTTVKERLGWNNAKYEAVRKRIVYKAQKVVRKNPSLLELWKEKLHDD